MLRCLAEHGLKLGKARIAAPLVMTPEYIQRSLDTFVAILRGKLFSAIALVLLVVLVSLPVSALCALSGGISTDLLFRSVTVIAVSALTYGMLSLAVSALCRTTFSALIISYALVAVCAGATWLPYQLLPVQVLRPASLVIRCLSPFDAIWSLLYPSNPLPDPLTWTDAEFSLFWISGTRRSRYDMPPFVTSGIGIPSNGNDRFLLADGVLTPVNGETMVYNEQAATECAYGSIEQGGYSYGDAFAARQAFTRLGPAILEGGSVVVGYPLVDSVNQDVLAVLIRPVGVDQFYVDSFDDTRYRLEAVGSTRHDQRPKIRATTLFQAPTQRSAGPFDAADIGGCFGNTSYDRSLDPGRHSQSTGFVRIQYRDLVTGRVSPLSIPHIEPVARRRARPFSLLVTNSQTV
jgi:hypothetical protein